MFSGLAEGSLTQSQSLHMATRQGGITRETNFVFQDIWLGSASHRAEGMPQLTGRADRQSDMENIGAESQSYDAQKPFKVFLSLLDRWEVGASLSDKLAVPALEAIRVGLPRVPLDMRGEVSR
jgi:hypothetical protein